MTENRKPFGEIPFPCSACDAECCKFYTITLTAFDLFRLIEFCKRTDFLACKPVEEVRSKRDHPFFLTKKGKPGEYFLCLKRDEKEICFFYGGGHICLVHPARPLVCRIYPLTQKADSSITYKKKHRCPADWKMDAKTIGDAEEMIAQQDRELMGYGKFCREWNAKYSKSGSFAEFVDFMYRKGKDAVVMDEQKRILKTEKFHKLD